MDLRILIDVILITYILNNFQPFKSKMSSESLILKIFYPSLKVIYVVWAIINNECVIGKYEMITKKGNVSA